MSQQTEKFTVYCYFNTPTGGKKLPVDITLVGDVLELQTPYFPPMIDEIKAMDRPENSWDPVRKIWRIKNNRRNLFALDILMNGNRIAVYDKPIPNRILSTRSLTDVKQLELLHKFWEHQLRMFNFMLTRKRCIVAAEMRTGKTLPTLGVINEISTPYAMWIAPLKAQKGVQREIKKWGSRVPIYLMTYESFRNKIEGFIEEHGVPKILIFDECHKLKTPGTLQTQEAQYISDLMYDTYEGEEYVIGLSGTPAPKNPGDWWSLCEVIQPGFLKESNRKKFERGLGEFEQREGAVGNLYWHLKEWKKDEVDRLYRRLQPLVQVHLKKDCLDLPPIRYERVELKPSKAMLRVAKTIADNEINVLSAINKLRQLSDGFQYKYEYNPDKNKKERIDTEYIGTPKEDQLREDLDEHEDVGRIIIFAGFQGSVDKVIEICLEKGWTVLRVDGRGEQVYLPGTSAHTMANVEFTGPIPTVDFCFDEMDRSTNTGTIEKLAYVGSPESGIGTELSASPTIIYYSNTNKGEARMQSEARAHSDNMDKNRGLTIKDYCHLPTDYKIVDQLQMKKDLQAISMGELKSVLSKEVEECLN